MRGDFARRDGDGGAEASGFDGDDEPDDGEGNDGDGPAQDEDEEEPSPPGGEILAEADPGDMDAFRDLLAAVISSLDNEEEDLLLVAQRADVETLDPDEMTPDELARLTYELAGSYPDALEAVTNRFPHAERLLVAVLGGESAFLAEQEE